MRYKIPTDSPATRALDAAEVQSNSPGSTKVWSVTWTTVYLSR